MGVFLLIFIIKKKNNSLKVKVLNVKKHLILLLLAMLPLLSGCEDKAMVAFYDRQLKSHPPTCLALSDISLDPSMKRSLESIYHFTQNCPWRLTIETKKNIHCNSNQNSQRKALTAFPNSYLRMDIRRGMRSLYSYYIDLTKAADSGDAERGLLRICDDLGLKIKDSYNRLYVYFK